MKKKIERNWVIQIVDNAKKLEEQKKEKLLDYRFYVKLNDNMICNLVLMGPIVCTTTKINSLILAENDGCVNGKIVFFFCSYLT